MFTVGYPVSFLNLTQASEITACFSELNLIYKLQRIHTHTCPHSLSSYTKCKWYVTWHCTACCFKSILSNPKSSKQWLTGIPVTHIVYCFFDFCFWAHSFKPFSVMEKNNKDVPYHQQSNWQQCLLTGIIHLGYITQCVMHQYTHIHARIHKCKHARTCLPLNLLTSSTLNEIVL